MGLGLISETETGLSGVSNVGLGVRGCVVGFVGCRWLG